ELLSVSLKFPRNCQTQVAMNMKKLFGFSALLFTGGSGFWAAFCFCNFFVVQAGDGSAGFCGDATAAFLDEFTTGGSSVQTIALPTSVSGLNNALTLSGTATSEGFIALSANGQYLTVGGYNAILGTAGVTTSVGNRSVGIIGLNG